MIRDLYVSLFIKCQKCRKKIDPKDGYWHWEKNPALKHGYYHTNCGTLNNPAPTGFFPF